MIVDVMHQRHASRLTNSHKEHMDNPYRRNKQLLLLLLLLFYLYYYIYYFIYYYYYYYYFVFLSTLGSKDPEG